MAKKKSNKAVALPNQNIQDSEHDLLVRYVNEADDATVYSRELSEKSRSYYDSEQWTEDEKAKLKKQKQAPTVINRIKPKIDALMGMERANRTTAKAQPRTPKHAKAATAATEAVRYCLEDNSYSRVRSDTWENMLIEGTGGIEIYVQPKGEEYKIVLRNIMWDRLIYDPHSRRKDFSDAKYLGQVVWMDYDDAVAMYPNAKDVLETMQSGSETYEDKPRWMDNTRRRVKIVELYYKKSDGDWWYACFTRGGYCEDPKKSPFLNEEGETEHAYEFASLFVDGECQRYGAEKQLIDIQDEINKRRSKALHLLSVRQTFGTAGAVADVNKARSEMAKPDGHVEFAYGELNKDFGILPTGDMVAGQFNLLSEAKMEIDSVGANSATMGKDKTVQSGVALRQRELTGQTELAPMFDILRNLDLRVYRKTWNRIKQYWKAEMWIRVTDDENNLKFVGLNKPQTRGEMVLQQAQEQGLPPEKLQLLKAQIQMDPTMQQVVSTENEIASLDVDIIMDEAPDTVTQEVEDFQAMAEMVKSGFPIPPEAVIMSSPLSNKDKILKMMKESPQVPPKVQEQIEKMQEGLQKAGEEVQKLQQENLALKQDQQSEQLKIAADAKAESEKAAIKKKQLDDEYRLKKEAQDREAQLARDKAIDEFNLKRDMMMKEYDLEKEMCDKKHGLEKEKMDFELKAKADELVPDEVRKAHIKGEVAKTDVMPQLMEGLNSLFGEMGKTMQEMVALQKQTLAAIQAPKRVSISGVQRDESGIVGASINSTPMVH